MTTLATNFFTIIQELAPVEHMHRRVSNERSGESMKQMNKLQRQHYV